MWFIKHVGHVSRCIAATNSDCSDVKSIKKQQMCISSNYSIRADMESIDHLLPICAVELEFTGL